MSANRERRRFTIEDAFEEETDDAIRVYGSTTERSPLKPKVRTNGTIPEDNIVVRIDNGEPRSPVPLKSPDDTASRDSDSLIQENFSPGMFDPSKSCWQHPKIRENWKMVLAAIVLLLIGIGLLTTGFLAALLPIEGLQSAVFFIAGAICFIPGAYHVVYIYLAVKGWQGFDFYHLPLFN
ncbi:transmembrane protein 134 [Neocloeon triangulifer]|uniref:transmembrane protein 134 n=1 Tax=Neocloeon triangulifer TaxID=2078957 RepID=UPI00286F03A7|nr:transmembrane protein 134 [Neocloeon triangulifer]